MHRDLNLSTSLKPVSWSSGHPTHCAAEQTISGYKIKLAIWGGGGFKGSIIVSTEYEQHILLQNKEKHKNETNKGQRKMASFPVLLEVILDAKILTHAILVVSFHCLLPLSLTHLINSLH